MYLIYTTILKYYLFKFLRILVEYVARGSVLCAPLIISSGLVQVQTRSTEDLKIPYKIRFTYVRECGCDNSRRLSANFSKSDPVQVRTVAHSFRTRLRVRLNKYDEL